MSEFLSSETGLSSGSVELGSFFKNIRQALNRIEDFSAFAVSLENLLRGLPELEHILLEKVDPPAPPSELAARTRGRRLVLPLSGDQGLLGTLTIPDKRNQRRLSASDLRLLSTLAGVTAGLLNISKRLERQSQLDQMVEQLFEVLPVGLILRSPDAAEPRLNATARRLIEHTSVDQPPDFPLIFGGPENGKNAFHLKCEDRFLFIRRFQDPAQPPADPSFRMALLYDLTREREQIHEFLIREAYRCRLQSKPLTVLLLQTGEAEDRLLSRCQDIQAALENGGLVGPVDAQSIAIVLPESPFLQARDWLRANRTRLPDLPLQAGFASVKREAPDGSRLMEECYASLEPIEAFFRDRILLADSYPPVNDTILLALGDAYHFHTPAGPRDLSESLHDGEIDGVVLDLEKALPMGHLLDVWAHRHPGFRAVLTSPIERSLPAELAHKSYISVLHKPFGPPELRDLFSRLWPKSNASA